MFDDKQFNVIAKVDKYGRKIDKKDTFALQNYYSKEVEEQGKKFYDENGNFAWEGHSSDSESGSAAGDREGGESSMSEMTYSDEVSGVWSDMDEPKDTAQPLADDAKVGRRLAVTNLDWDSIGATALLVLFQSFCTQLGRGQITRVQIYPSLFGIEQMKKEAVAGPPKTMFSDKRKIKRRKGYGRNEFGKQDKEYMSDDEFQLDENDAGYNMASLRKYEVDKMKYYYAVITCDKRKTASKIYGEYNGFELELTNLKLQLSFVPDELEFP